LSAIVDRRGSVIGISLLAWLLLSTDVNDILAPVISACYNARRDRVRWNLRCAASRTQSKCSIDLEHRTH